MVARSLTATSVRESRLIPPQIPTSETIRIWKWINWKTNIRWNVDWAGLSTTKWSKDDRNAYLSGLVAGDRGDRTNLISNFWKAYKNQHQPSVDGGRESMRLEPRQSQLEAF